MGGNYDMIIDIYTDKRKQCYNKNIEYHNSYGPDEINSKGYKSYCRYGFYHNVHSYAVFHPEDDITKYYLDGDELTKKEWEQRRHEY